MKPLILLSAFIVWWTLCRLIPDHNTGTAVFLLVPVAVFLIALRVTNTTLQRRRVGLCSQSSGEANGTK